ncbi:PQQ-like beta-propeller repeat protein, partial [bacterium]|nr:PQQ-like beta-propeller repeat protein [bacterium]
ACKNAHRFMTLSKYQSRLMGLGLLAAITIPSLSNADSWPQWRGPNRDGKSTETDLLEKWPEQGPTIVWKATKLGDGYATPSVDQGKIFGTGYRGDNEFAWALNESDGSLLWETRTADAEKDVGYGHGPRSTPTVSGPQVFTLGAGGHLTCLETSTGTILWQRNLKEDFEGKMMSGWGYSESVLVDGDRVLCSPGGKNGTVVCLNRNTGKQVWRTTQLKDRAAYTSITKEIVHGTIQYITLTGETVAGIAPSNGRLLWQAERRGKTAVVPTPIYHDGKLFVTSGYNVGSNLFEVTKKNDRFTAKQSYANRNIKNHHGGAILVGDHVYASSGPILVCLELSTGEIAWDQRSVGKGSLTYADGHLYLRSEKGPIALIEANPNAYVEKGRFNQPERSGRQSWAHPVIANGHLFLRDQGTLFTYDLKPQG